MDPVFRGIVGGLDAKVDQLLETAAVTATTLPRDVPKAGIYVFSEPTRHLYVGRSNRIRQRIGNHQRDSSGHNQATFAFLLAREASGKREATYSEAGSREALLADPAFAAAFKAAKVRIRAMELRFVEEAEPLKQALLEIYAHVRLQTPYNDFDTH